MKSAPIILTLDAGGTNFVFSAMRNFKEVAGTITLHAHAHDLDKCIASIISGFEKLVSQVKNFDAISFAFPGPANYALGIIGDLPNFKAFRGGVPLGAILQNHFNVPVYINNDGNLFASGVALAGYLPELNTRLKSMGSKKQFQNLIGITLGTGFGCGIVSQGHLIRGDNFCGAEIHNLANTSYKDWNIEESVSTRAIQRVYAEQSGTSASELMPKEIFEVARGEREGNKEAAIKAFTEYGKALGSAIVNTLALIDGVVVIGGGLSASWELFAPPMFNEINRKIENAKGEQMNRLSYQVYNLEDASVFNEFAEGETRDISVPGTDKVITYDAKLRTGVALSKLEGSRAISLGAYAFALNQMHDEKV